MRDKKTFGEFITQKRKEAGLTQKSCADQLFVTESAVSKWERGISFPDITLIRDICETLHINEHELLTASEDLEGRNTERIARKYIKMVERYKIILSVIYGISLLTCFICNLAVAHTLSWFFIVLTSELVAFSFTILPVMLKKNKGLITLAVFFGSTVLLLLTCNIYSHGDWFLVAFISILFGMTLVFLPFILARIGLPEFASKNKALMCFIIDTVLLLLLLFIVDLYTKGGWFLSIAAPITLFSLILPWSMLFIIRYCRMNGFLKTSACLAAMTAFAFFVNGFINAVLGIEPYKFGFPCNFSKWNNEYVEANINMIIILSLILMTVIFAIAGIVKSLRSTGEIQNKNQE